MKPFRARGRFEIVCVFEDGAYLRVTSDKTRSMPPAELVEHLRKFAGHIEEGLQAAAAEAKEQS
jgi:hypothetical protein